MTHMWNEIREEPAAIKRCHEKNMPIIDRLVDELSQRQIDQVVIAARGTSDHAAVYGKYIIELMLGLPVSLAASSVFTIYQKSLAFKNALVIGISQSGRAADVLEVLKGANKYGALTIGITNDAGSPIAGEVKYHLNCEAGAEKSVAATKTFVTQIYLLAQLAAHWAKDGDLKRELMTVPDRIAPIFDLEGNIAHKVARYRFMQECFILARGLNYAISLEAALKIQETTYVRAKAFATSDFQHGPIAMLDSDIPVFIYAPEGPTLGDMTAMANKMRENRIETVVISNNADLLKMGDCSFVIPDTQNDMISPFFNAVIAQMIACELSLAKGLNPDSPKGLNKVTVTR